MPENPLLFTIGIITHNRQLLLQRAVESVLQQAEGYALEIVIVDDGSTDATAQYCNELASNIPFVKIIRLEQASGRSVARNRVVEEAQGEFLLWLDDDDIFLPTHLQTYYELVHTDGFVAENTLHRTAYQSFFDAQNIRVDVIPERDSNPKQYANLGVYVVKQMLTNQSIQDPFPYLWSFVGSIQTYRQFAFNEDVRTLEDAEWLCQFFTNGGTIRVYPQFKPTYRFYRYLAHERNHEDDAEERLASVDHLFTWHHDYFQQHCESVDREQNARKYLIATRQYRNSQDLQGLWRTRMTLAHGDDMLESLLVQDIYSEIRAVTRTQTRRMTGDLQQQIRQLEARIAELEKRL